MFGKSAPLSSLSSREYFALRRVVAKFRLPATQWTSSAVNISLAALVGFFGIAIALMTLRRGIWADEFITIAWTSPGTSPREFLRLMINRDFHPILYYGLVYVLQTAGETDVARLRSVNLLGLPLVISAMAYGIRQKTINLTQALIVLVLFASSPIFFEHFAELRCYFLLYAASIASSVLWYVLMRQIDTGGKIPGTMILVWAACLAIFVNLHYFATIFGGMLTAALLARLAVRRKWSQALAVGGAGLAAAAPALILGALQVFSTRIGMMSWIRTGLIESIELSLRMIENASAWNLAVVAGAVVTCLFALENRRKWVEIRTATILLGIVVLFLGILVILNAITPLMVDRYLIASAGAVTFSLAILTASSGAPIWMPGVACAIALLLQAQIFRSNLIFDATRGWLSSAKAVAQLKSECPTTRVFTPIYRHLIGRSDDIAVARKINSVSYGYYAKKFLFSYEDLLPGTTIGPTGSCPSIIWIEHAWRVFELTPNATAEEVLNQFSISKIGRAEWKRYGSGIVMVIHE